MNANLKLEVDKLREEVRLEHERLKSKKKALRKLEGALEQLTLEV